MRFTSSFIKSMCLYLSATVTASPPSTSEQLDRNDPIYRAALEKECGPLGVMEVPEGSLESKVRHCREHPLSLKYPHLFRDHVHPSEWPMGIEEEPKGRNDLLHDLDFAPDLSGGAQFGCEKNACWRVCNSPGGWCWVAQDTREDAPWLECSVVAQCGEGIGVTIAQ